MFVRVIALGGGGGGGHRFIRALASVWPVGAVVAKWFFYFPLEVFWKEPHVESKKWPEFYTPFHVVGKRAGFIVMSLLHFNYIRTCQLYRRPCSDRLFHLFTSLVLMSNYMWFIKLDVVGKLCLTFCFDEPHYSRFYQTLHRLTISSPALYPLGDGFDGSTVWFTSVTCSCMIWPEFGSCVLGETSGISSLLEYLWQSSCIPWQLTFRVLEKDTFALLLLRRLFGGNATLILSVTPDREREGF